MRVMLPALAALLFAFQWHTLGKLGAVMPPGRFRSAGQLLATARGQGVSFDTGDGLLATAILALALGVVAAEWRGRRLTAFLDGVLATDCGAIALLVATSAVLGRAYLAPGEPGWTGDGPAHVAYARFAAMSLALGETPIWTNATAAGSPYCSSTGSCSPRSSRSCSSCWAIRGWR